VRAGVAFRNVCAGAAVVVAAFVVTPHLFDLDDAYIPLYSALVAVRGSDPVYGAPVLAGATCPAYVALLIALLSVGIQGLLALRIATALGLSAYVLAVWRLGGALRLSVPHKATLLTLTLGSGLVFMQATNGLETGWALALLTLAISEAIRQNLMMAVAAATLLPFLRPDMIPAAAVTLLFAARDTEWRTQLRAGALALLISGPILLWLRLDTGAWIPQTMQAKTFFFAESCQPLRLKAMAVYVAVSAFLLITGPLVIYAAVLWRERLGGYAALAIGLSLAAFMLRFPGGLSHNYSRYLYPIFMPWLSLGAAVRLRRGGSWADARAVATVIAATAIVWPLIQPARVDAARELRNATEWIDANVPAGAVVLVHDAGAISVFAHRRAVDLVGLKTASSIDAHRHWTLPSCGRDRAQAVAEIATASHASYFMVVSDWDEIFQLRAGLEANGFVLARLRAPGPNVRGYSIYRITAERREAD